MKENNINKSKCLLSLEDYTIYFQVGKGGQSNVYFAIDSKTSKPVAIKVSNGKIYSNAFTKEIDFMNNSTHPFILKNLSSLKKSNENKKAKEYYAIELAPEGNLQEYIWCNGNIKEFPEFVIKHYTRQILSAQEYVHEKGYSHNDQKLENLLLDKDFNIKQTDFGCLTKQLKKTKSNGSNSNSNTPSNSASKFVGSEYYIAPELYQGSYPDEKNDLFALGVCIFILYFAFPPWSKASVIDQLYKHYFSKKKNEFWKFVENRKKNKSISNELKDLLDGLFECDPTKRYSLEDVKNHLWLNSKNDLLLTSNNIQKDEFIEKESVKKYMDSMKHKARKEYYKQLNSIPSQNSNNVQIMINTSSKG